MEARLRSWLQLIKTNRIIIQFIAIFMAIVIILILIGYQLDWTGFNAYTITAKSNANGGTILPTNITVYQPSKTLWDWLQLLIIPLVLAVAALLFNFATTRTEQKFAAQRYEQDKNLALEKQREDLLQVYLDRMSELLLDKQLRTSEPDTEVRNVARVRTITILFQLDARRIGYVFTFLREAGLMSNTPNSSIVSLSQTDLTNINMSQANLSNANLSNAYLSNANLSNTNLNGANLYKANLSNANLSNANLDGTNLSNAHLDGANLSEANLTYAHLSGANLSEANLSNANLHGADLSEANLFQANLKNAILRNVNLFQAFLMGANLFQANLLQADLHEADLHEADLSNANLSEAKVTKRQLAQASSLRGATMPDGSIHP